MKFGIGIFLENNSGNEQVGIIDEIWVKYYDATWMLAAWFN